MSAETMEWLRNMIRIGYTDAEGPAWHASTAKLDDGTPEYLADGSHYPGPVPESEVRRLLDVQLIEAQITATFQIMGEKDFYTDPDRKGIILARGREVLGMPGVFKSGYQTHPFNEWTNQSIQRMLHEHPGWGTKSIGLLRKGAVAFHQVNLPDTVTVAGFGFVPKLTAFTSCDGSLASGASVGLDAAVCDNTLSLAIRQAVTKRKFKHTRNSAPRASELAEALNLDIAQETADFVSDLTNAEVSDKEFDMWLDTMVPMPEPQKTKTGGPGRAYTIAEHKRDELIRLYDHDPKVSPWRGTELGILQAWNTMRTWNGTVQRAQGGKIERNWTNDITGVSAQDDAKALDALADIRSKTLTFA